MATEQKKMPRRLYGVGWSGRGNGKGVSIVGKDGKGGQHGGPTRACGAEDLNLFHLRKVLVLKSRRGIVGKERGCSEGKSPGGVLSGRRPAASKRGPRRQGPPPRGEIWREVREKEGEVYRTPV